MRTNDLNPILVSKQSIFYQSAGMRMIFFISLSVFLPGTAFAQLNECNGVWSNKPCDKVSTDKVSQYKSSVIDESVEEGAFSNAAEAGPDASKKRRIVHALVKQTNDARRKYGFRTDLELVRSVCLEQPSTLEICSKAVNEVGDRLNERVKAADELALKRRELELKEREEQSRGSENNATSVTVLNTRNTLNINEVPRGSELTIHGSGEGISVGVRQRREIRANEKNEEQYRGSRGDDEDSRRPHREHKERGPRSKMDAPIMPLR